MTPDGHSVTHWLLQLKDGHTAAFDPLFLRYYDQLTAYADARLPPAGDVSGQDIANSALRSFWRGVMDNRFPKLNNRNDLVRVLCAILSHKIADRLRKRSAQKRGGDLRATDPDALNDLPTDAITPDKMAECDEEFHRLLDLLETKEMQSIALWKLEGYADKEIADLLGCSLRKVTGKITLIRKTWEAEVVT